MDTPFQARDAGCAFHRAPGTASERDAGPAQHCVGVGVNNQGESFYGGESA
jgi:hypothetical protein